MILYQIIYLKEILKEMSKDSFYFHLFLTDFEIQNLKQRFRVLVKDQIIFLHKLSFELYIKKKAVKYLNITYDSISHIYLWFWFDGILLEEYAQKNKLAVQFKISDSISCLSWPQHPTCDSSPPPHLLQKVKCTFQIG